MNRFTGSQVGRYLQCVGAAVIPAVPRLMDEGEREKPSIARGDVVHEYLENVNKLGLEEAMTRVPEGFLEMCVCIDTSQLPAGRPQEYSAEVDLAWDPLTRVARIGKARPGELGGTLDALGVGENTVFVEDYKTGKKWLGRAELSAQLRTYAMMAVRATGRHRAEVAFIRINQDGEPMWIRATFEAEDIAEIELELVALTQRIYEVEEMPLELVPVVEGPACHWCPSYTRCPAKRVLLAGAEGTLDLRTAIKPEDIGRAYVRLKLVEEALKRAKDVVNDAVKAFGSVPLPNGNVLVKAPRKEAEFTDTGEEALLGMYGQEAVDAVVVVERSLTVGRFDKYIKSKWTERYGKAKGVTDEVKKQREAMHLVKGMKTVVSYRLEEVSAKTAAKMLDEQNEAKDQPKEEAPNDKEE